MEFDDPGKIGNRLVHATAQRETDSSVLHRFPFLGIMGERGFKVRQGHFVQLVRFPLFPLFRERGGLFGVGFAAPVISPGSQLVGIGGVLRRQLGSQHPLALLDDLAEIVHRLGHAGLGEGRLQHRAGGHLLELCRRFRFGFRLTHGDGDKAGAEQGRGGKK